MSLADAIFLEASVSEVSKKIVSAIGKQEKEFLCQQFAAVQRKVSALQIGVSNPTAYYPANYSTAHKLDNNDQSEANDFAKLAPRRGNWASGDGEGFRRSPKENGVEAIYALSSFPSTTPLIYTMQLDPTHHDHHSLLPPPLFGSSQQPEVSLTWTKKSRNG